MQKDEGEIKEQNDTAEAISREHISYGGKLTCHVGTIDPPARKHGQAVPPGGGPGGAAGIKCCLGWFRTFKGEVVRYDHK